MNHRECRIVTRIFGQLELLWCVDCQTLVRNSELTSTEDGKEEQDEEF